MTICEFGQTNNLVVWNYFVKHYDNEQVNKNDSASEEP